jgi:hypothetical protein
MADIIEDWTTMLPPFSKLKRALRTARTVYPWTKGIRVIYDFLWVSRYYMVIRHTSVTKKFKELMDSAMSFIISPEIYE